MEYYSFIKKYRNGQSINNENKSSTNRLCLQRHPFRRWKTRAHSEKGQAFTELLVLLSVWLIAIAFLSYFQKQLAETKRFESTERTKNEFTLY